MVTGKNGSNNSVTELNIEILPLFSTPSPGVVPHCLDAGTVTGVTTEMFHGQEWEATFKVHAQSEDGIHK